MNNTISTMVYRIQYIAMTKCGMSSEDLGPTSVAMRNHELIAFGQEWVSQFCPEVLEY